MKLFKKVSIVFSLFLVIFLSACGTKKSSKNKTTSKTTTKSTTKKTTSKKATTSSDKVDLELMMENFVKNVDACNYTVTGEDFRISVCSKDLVIYEFNRSGYNDFAAMSVKNETYNVDEVFQAFIKNGELKNLQFVEYGNSIDACSSKLLALNYLTDLYGDNMFDAFYNVVDNDGTFVSYNSDLRYLMQKLGTYSEMISSSMEEVYLIIDDEEASGATLTAHVYNAASRMDFDITYHIEFNNATSLDVVDEWMESPVYPTNPVDWSMEQAGAIDTLFNLYSTEESCKAVPFIDGASYALYLDSQSALYYNEIIIYDAHATETIYNNYLAKLDTLGFVEATDEDGDPCYRLKLRDESKCYSQIYVEYEDGISVLAEIYYDFTKYTGLDTINPLIDGNGFVELENDTNLVSVKAYDATMAEEESYIYQSEYAMVLFVDMEFSDEASMEDYLDEYLEALEEAGYICNQSMFNVYPYYTSEDTLNSIYYNMDYVNTLLQFKYIAEKKYTLTEINTKITAKGYDGLAFNTGLVNLTAKDGVKHELILNGKNYELYFEVKAIFDYYTSCDAFVDAYIDTLENSGFVRVSNAGLGKPYQYKNNNTGLLFGFEVISSPYTTEMSVVMIFAIE